MMPLTPSSRAFWARTAALDGINQGSFKKGHQRSLTMLPPALPPPTMIRSGSTSKDPEFALHCDLVSRASADCGLNSESDPFEDVKAVINGVGELKIRSPVQRSTLDPKDTTQKPYALTCDNPH